MQEEIFEPILPILEVDSVEAVIAWVNSIPSRLGPYVFTEDDEVAEHILAAASSGDAVVNDCAVYPPTIEAVLSTPAGPRWIEDA